MSARDLHFASYPVSGIFRHVHTERDHVDSKTKERSNPLDHPLTPPTRRNRCPFSPPSSPSSTQPPPSTRPSSTSTTADLSVGVFTSRRLHPTIQENPMPVFAAIIAVVRAAAAVYDAVEHVNNR